MSSTWLSARALKLHATTLLVIAGCLALGWWQLSRALSGNSLSWVYTFEWPFFAAYAVYMWWKLLHEPLAATRAVEIDARRRELDRRGEFGALVASGEGEETTLGERVDEIGFDPYDESDPDLAAYNRYLASLHRADVAASAKRRPSGQPGEHR